MAGLAVLALGAPGAGAYVLVKNPVWPQAGIEFHIVIPDQSDEFNAAFGAAVDVWNAATDFAFDRIADSDDPCLAPQIVQNVVTRHNGIVFRDTTCDDSEFGETLLAVTKSWFTSAERLQSGIIFNTKWNWTVYNGPWQADPADFRRVAMHELGHVIGLGHTRVLGVMAAKVGDIETPQADDILGVQAMYGFVARPANDDFAAAATLTGFSATATGGNQNAGTEDGEPSHAGATGGASVWWRWSAPAAGGVTVTATASGVDTLLAVYIGGEVDALTEIAANGDGLAGGGASEVGFVARAGTTYHIAVDARSAAFGNVELALDLVPRNDLVINFSGGMGVWVYLNDSDLEQINVADPRDLIVANIDGAGEDDVIADFGPDFGLWVRRNNGTWAKFNALSTVHMASGDLDGNGAADVITDFGPQFGTYVKMNDTTWTRLNVNTTEGIMTGDLDGNGMDEVVLDLGSLGAWVKMNNASWERLNVNSPKAMTTADLDGNGMDEAVLDLGQHGIWIKRNNAAWEQISTATGEAMAVADLDGDGRQDLIVDFGAASGLRVYKNDGGFQDLQPMSAQGMVAADLDSNGQEDLIIDFGPGFGIQVWRNDSSLTALNDNSARAMATGDIDGL